MIAARMTTRFTRAASLVPLTGGLILVFAGINSAVGWSATGILASVAAVASLVYAGAAWFGSPGVPADTPVAEPVLVFDRSLRLVAGLGRGQPLIACFPVSARAEIQRSCTAVLRGESTRFSCDKEGVSVALDAVPVRSADGTVVYGLLLAAAAPAGVESVRGGV